MKGKRKVILGSALAIALSASMIAGSTFALFTSESSVNIAVTSANVKVSAAVDENSFYTKQLNDAEYIEGLDHTLSGQVTVSKDGIEVLGFAPGDGVKFNLTVANESTVGIKYRAVVKFEGDIELANALNVAFGENGTVYDGSSVYTQWTAVTEKKTETVPVTVEFPDEESNQNAFGNKSCTITYKVEAVQGNAVTTDGVARITRGEETKDYLTLQAAFEDAKLNDTVVLCEDFTITQRAALSAEAVKGFTLDGNGHTIHMQCIKHNGDGSITPEYGLIFGLGGEKNDTAMNITVKNLNVTGEARVGIQLRNGYNHVLENVNVNGSFYSSAVNFYGNGGGTIKNSKICNNFPAENGYYFPYGATNAIAVFANRHAQNKVTIVGSVIDTIFLNSYLKNGIETYAGQSKYIIGGGTEIERLIADRDVFTMEGIYETVNGGTIGEVIHAEYED